MHIRLASGLKLLHSYRAYTAHRRASQIVPEDGLAQAPGDDSSLQRQDGVGEGWFVAVRARRTASATCSDDRRVTGIGIEQFDRVRLTCFPPAVLIGPIETGLLN